MNDQILQNCIDAARLAGLENSEQMSRESVLLRFPQLCKWYLQTLRELERVTKENKELKKQLKES